ncbi:MAG: S8 family serine peptidase [Deltaproteobacteria bacterium]|nr:S8 family serine peptidase [Deltaproteobacteria bacterium]
MRVALLVIVTIVSWQCYAEEPLLLEAQPDVLVVKSKDPMDRWGATELWDSFRVSNVASEIVSIRPAFPQSELSWGSRDELFPASHYFTVRLKKGTSLSNAIREISAFGSVESVQPDYWLSDPLITFSDPKFKDQWYVQKLKIDEAWEVATGKGVSVADVESGFDTEHPDLKNQFDKEKSYDYDPKTDDAHKVNDNKRSHGTPVCGIIAAQANNNLFGVGVAFDAKLIGSQMANTMDIHSTESVWTVNAARAILGSAKNGASVVLIEKQIPSLESSVERVKVIYDAIKATVAGGVAVVVPAGNFGTELKEEAAQEDTGSIVVGATMQNDNVAFFSNYGTRVNVAAPGENVYSTQEDGAETSSFGGTSSASAIVAGVVALVRSANMKLSPKELREVLVETGMALAGERKVGVLVQAGPAVRQAQKMAR